MLSWMVMIWGVNWPVMKLALAHMPPIWLACARSLATSFVLFLALGLTGRLRLPGRSDLPVLVSVGVCLMTLTPAFSHAGLFHTDSGRAALLSFVTPLWVTPIAIALLGERLTRLKACGLALALGGLIVLFNPADFDWSDRGVIVGNALLLLSSVSWAVAILHLRVHRWSRSPLELAPWQALIGGCLLALIALVFETGPDVRWNAEIVLLLLYAGPLAMGLTVWGSVVISSALPAIVSSLGFLGTPAIGILAGAIILGEPLTATILGGLVLIVLGLGLVAGAEREAKEARPNGRA